VSRPTAPGSLLFPRLCPVWAHTPMNQASKSASAFVAISPTSSGGCATFFTIWMAFLVLRAPLPSVRWPFSCCARPTPFRGVCNAVVDAARHLLRVYKPGRGMLHPHSAPAIPASRMVLDPTQYFPPTVRVKWLNLNALILTHIFAIYAVFFVPRETKTMIFALFYYVFSMLGQLPCSSTSCHR
jgi:hypothetical protein